MCGNGYAEPYSIKCDEHKYVCIWRDETELKISVETINILDDN